ncbi:glycosyltransferase family 10 domain-containing protein [Marinobacterium lacunae]|uniref:glycosyltransferase family 10 domain-containing protein n=1 Tax=Marinobacterium lacunae TaxID=1232683 RepID=UPI0005687365|nr:glycosyltransferase family 10 [Marinobacterium lacunae]
MSVTYIGFWKDFKPENWLIHRFFENISTGNKLTVVGPFLTKKDHLYLRLNALFNKKADFFVTGENENVRFDIARCQIGFWKSYSGNQYVLRFPNWMWHIDWEGLDEQPEYLRYGRRLSLDRLLNPIRSTYEDRSKRVKKAVIFTSHLREPRGRLYEIVNNILGCDGFGSVFSNAGMSFEKYNILEGYNYCLCPENSIGDGYITEKIPEAFYAGCIPITWCRPEDLLVDFNENAVVNLYGLDDSAIESVLRRLLNDKEYVEDKLNTPLLKRKPNINDLKEFIEVNK